MSRVLGLALLVALAGAAALSCPDSRQCYCFEESASEQRVHCAAGNGTTTAAFDLTVRRHERLLVECVGGPDWADFLLGSPLDVGPAKTLVFASCGPPGAEHSRRVAGLLGASGVEVLRFNALNGSLGRHDLGAYPSVKSLALSNNNLTGVGSDLLRGTFFNSSVFTSRDCLPATLRLHSGPVSPIIVGTRPFYFPNNSHRPFD
jgi:hypothetical protein